MRQDNNIVSNIIFHLPMYDVSAQNNDVFCFFILERVHVLAFCHSKMETIQIDTP